MFYVLFAENVLIATVLIQGCMFMNVNIKQKSENMFSLYSKIVLLHPIGDVTVDTLLYVCQYAMFTDSVGWIVCLLSVSADLTLSITSRGICLLLMSAIWLLDFKRQFIN